MRAHAHIRIRCERVQCEHMRAYANARIRIASHANAFLMRHASIHIRYLGVFRVRYARICAHSHAMRAHSHRMRSHRMRMRAFKGNLCVSGTVTGMLDPLWYRWGVPSVVIRCVHWTMQMGVLQAWITTQSIVIVMGKILEIMHTLDSNFVLKLLGINGKTMQTTYL